MSMAQWQLDSDEYLARLGLDRKGFEKELRLPKISEMKKIIPLREIREVESIIPIPFDLLVYLIRRIQTLDGQLPFKDAEIEQIMAHPPQLKIGQRFVYRENYQNLLENMSNLFKGIFGGWSQFGNWEACFVFGTNGDGNYSMACYLPPIIEVHDQRYMVMDGIHRNYIGLQTGLTIKALRVKKISVPFPCSPRNWREIEVISLTDKPKTLEDRYFNLQKNLFRDLKYLGIDG